MLILLGDYVHGGENNRGVLDKIMRLQRQYGSDKVVALLGNHDEWVVDTEEDKYYRVTEAGNWLVFPYDDEA